ncbi:hypothetical protein, partial [Rhodopseudomonas palustris]|uniref:hypothetical protein n=1 Tax=Rhodopseudomonas palustris TaxID=1076 RepID=UPI001A9E5945
NLISAALKFFNRFGWPSITSPLNLEPPQPPPPLRFGWPSITSPLNWLPNHPLANTGEFLIDEAPKRI